MVSGLNSQLGFSPTRIRPTTFSDYRRLAVNRNTERHPTVG